MTLRDAAALALVGWYLMLPPIQNDSWPNTDAPLSQWSIGGSFDTAKECQDEKVDNAERTEKTISAPPATLSLAAARQALVAVCIATDDPRLKGN